MKITCEKKELVQAIQTVLKAVPSRPQMPILSGIYIKAHQNYIELQGTDYEISIICKIKAIIEYAFMSDTQKALAIEKIISGFNEAGITVKYR